MFLEKNWALIAGLCSGVATLLFLMALIIMTMIVAPVPDSSRIIVVTVIALGMALANAFIGGNAAATGRLPLVFEKYSLEFSAVGGVATFLIVFIVGSIFYVPGTDQVVRPWDKKLSTLKSAGVRISNVDDSMTVRVNGQPVVEAFYGKAPAEVDVLKLLRRGVNDIEVEIKNNQFGGCSGNLKLIVNGEEDQRFHWSWKNNFAESNSVCFAEKETLTIS
jgi:hypothetical protein